MINLPFYTDRLSHHEQCLKENVWPLPPVDGVDYYIDLGIDPSMSSSGLCGILRKDTEILRCLTLNYKTESGVPTPLRLGSMVQATRNLIVDLLREIPPSRIHITVLTEIPPTTMSSSGWLFALCQMLWLGLGPDAPELVNLQKIHTISMFQLGIGVPQLKNVYLHWAPIFNIATTFKEVSKRKSICVKIIKNVIERTSLQPLLPKRYNNDIAEGIALAFLAGGCSRLDMSHTLADAPYPLVPMEDLKAFMFNKQVNKSNQRIGWIYRPLEYSFGWCSPLIVPPVSIVI